MELKDIIPETPEFFLASKQKTYEIRIPNMEDRIYFNNRYGDEKNLQDIFEKKNWSEIFRIGYRLLKDKSDFVAVEVTEINDDGIKETKLISGVTSFIRSFGDSQEVQKFLAAITAAFIAGEPLARKYVEDTIKKNKKEDDLTTQKFLT